MFLYDLRAVDPEVLPEGRCVETPLFLL